MNTTNIRIIGENVKEIINLIDDNLKINALQPANEIYIYCSEKFYLRNNSQLMVVLIVNLQEEKSCKINIIAGAGSVGLIGGSDMGAETHMIRKISESLEKICNANGWLIECIDEI